MTPSHLPPVLTRVNFNIIWFTRLAPALFVRTAPVVLPLVQCPQLCTAQTGSHRFLEPESRTAKITSIIEMQVTKDPLPADQKIGLTKQKTTDFHYSRNKDLLENKTHSCSLGKMGKGGRQQRWLEDKALHNST